MKNIKYALLIAAAAIAVASCEEFQPVFTGKYPEPEEWTPVEMERTHTIAELTAMYTTGKPWTIDKDIVISGRVSTNDRPGNFYKSFYIQDETGGIEIKMGKNALYNDYKPGQTIYVDCNGLTLGMYGFSSSNNYGGNGMVQLGYEDPSGAYESSYFENQLIIDKHIFRGPLGDELTPEVITSAQLPDRRATLATCPYIGKLVTLKGLKYNNEAFVLLYLNSNKDKKSSSNRIFLSDSAWGITTWAMSKAKMTEYIKSGVWDSCKLGNANDQNYGTVGDRKGDGSYPDIEKAAYSVSQYFNMDGKEIQIRTSGYCRFCDTEIDPAVLSGAASIDVTGILTMYQGGVQFVVNNISDIVVNK